MATALTIERFRADAAELLLVISRSRAPHDHHAYDGHWRRLWELIRAARVAGVDFRPHDRGPWAIRGPDTGGPDLQLYLVGGTEALWLRSPPQPTTEYLNNPGQLDQLLNGAGVQPPWRNHDDEEA